MKKRQYPYEEYHQTINGELYKKCAYHEEYFPDDNPWFPCTSEYFYKNNKNKADGLYPECKKCSSAKFGKWAKENKDKHNEYNREAYNKNKWDVKGIMRKNAKRRRENGEYREWQRKNPDRIKKHNLYRTLHKTHNINNREWEACLKYFNYCCAYCGMTEVESLINFNERLHKEHVKHDGSNNLDNCIPACKECNSEKYTKVLDEWYNVNNIKYLQERKEKILQWIYNDYKQYVNTNQNEIA